jgi:uncharacterized membrane protein
MAFCTQCGAQVGDGDLFCAQCGARQRDARTGSAAAPPPPFVPPVGASFAPPPPSAGPRPRRHKEFLADWEDNHVEGLCYIPIVGWIFAIIVLAGQRFRDNRNARFHAFQGLYIFVVWLIIDWVFSPIAGHSHVTSRVSGLLQLGLIGLGIFMLIKTRQGEMVRLPFLGELAEKSVAEQK